MPQNTWHTQCTRTRCHVHHRIDPWSACTGDGTYPHITRACHILTLVARDTNRRTIFEDGAYMPELLDKAVSLLSESAFFGSVPESESGACPCRQEQAAAPYDAALLLLLLCMDVETLEKQVPAGRYLTHCLECMGVRDNPGVRNELFLEAQAFLTQSDSYWDAISGRRASILKTFSTNVRGRKGDVMNAFEKRVDESSVRRAYYPSMLQIVYGSGARQQIIMDRCVLAFPCEFHAHASPRLQRRFTVTF